MERACVRSSARLSGGGGGGSAGSNGGGDRDTSRAEAARRAAAAALAAERRARARERAQEVEDSPSELREKCRELARAVRRAKHLVVYTGAGISTAADIPDYRGPRGVWTRLQRGEDIGRVEVSRAQPTFTHMALAALVARGRCKFVVSQNCDGLHVRSGLPRRALAELHGDMFAERCAAPRCRAVLLRAFDTTQRTRRYAHATRRTCPLPRCGRPLRDTIVHFGERARAAWPLNWAGALRHAAAADVILCLGSSLKVLRRYPRLWCMARPARARPRLYIVNLQWTPKDAAAELKINARCDAVMRELARRLRLRVPPYRARRDPLLAHATPLAPAEQHTCSRPALSPPAPAPAGDDSSEGEETEESEEDGVPLRRLAERLRHPEPDGVPLRRLAERLRHPEPDGVPLRRLAERLRHPEPDGVPLRRLAERLRHPEPDGVPLRRLAECLRHREHEPDEKKPKLENGICHEKDELTSFEVTLADGAARILLRAAHAPEPKEEEDEGGGLARLLRLGPRPARADSGSESEASRAAAAFIARAVLVCRAQLYPGLHTILAAPPPAPRAAQVACAWCAQHYSSRRCLWYPARDPLAAGRVWRRVRGRRYLCACCPRADADADEPESSASGGEGGWYGKGYRKGRRKRR